MKKALLLVFLLTCAVLPHLAKAQGGISVSQDGDVCPDKDYTYTYTGSALGCKWVIKGEHTVVYGGGSNYASITVRWKDVPTDANSNPTAVTMDCGTGSPTSRPVFVSSISNVTPAPLTVNGTPVGTQLALPFGDNAALTLKVPLVELPQSKSNSVFLAAVTYEWVIPAGWRYNDGTNYVSNGTTPHRVSGSPQAGNQISVTPAPSTDGTISVRAVNDRCINNSSAGTDNSLSQTLRVNVTRPTPSLTIISDKMPAGGGFSISCGDQSDYHFRPATGAVPSGGFFDNYSFYFIGPITPNGPVANAAPVTNFTGATGSVGVSLIARYTRNGASITVSAPSIGVTVQPLPRPLISSSLGASDPAGPYPVLCPGSTATFATTVAGANSYTWTATGGLTVGGATTLTTTGASSSVVVGPGSGNGQGTITVAAANTSGGSCASPISVAYNLVYGGPPAHDGSLTMHSDGYPGYEANCPYGCSGVCPNSNVTLRPRDPSAGLLTEAVWKVYQVDVTPAQLVYTQTATGAQANTSTLRFKAGPVVGARYEVQLLERNACSVGPPNTYSLEVINCARGDEPFFTAPGQPATEAVAAYPNPADNDLTLEQGGGTVRLSDAYGKPVHSQASQPGRLHLDTSHLPAGLYFLEMRSAKGQPVRKQIHVRH